MAHDQSSKKGTGYTAHSIRVMEGLEAVRKRPAMYIGSTSAQGLHHLVYEVVDNSVDESLAGYCNNIKVILHQDGSCSVEDNGRGIPTDIHPTEGVSAAEVVLTKLHAGGKFDKETYKFSGGLHGVGVSVVNALSTWLRVTIFQNGTVYEQLFERGKPTAPLAAIGTTDKRGTLVRFLPDPEIFKETVEFSFETLSARLRELAFLNKKLRISIFDERTDRYHEFFFEGGIVSFVEYINKKKTPLFPEIIHFEHSDDTIVVELAMQYNEGYGEQLYSFVNNINTVEGGTHVSGFRSALTKLCNKKAQEFGILKSNTDGFSSEDVREGLVCVLSLKVPEPQFEGQTKTKLGNSDIKGIVDSWCSSHLDTYFEEHPAVAKKILQKAEVARQAREAAKKARELTRRKTVLESAILPGKLADCTNEDPTDAELFIVEGESAGGSAKQGRDRANQAILPLRGKILNVEKARFDRVLSHEEIRALITAIGCGIGTSDFDINKARYHKIILMTDADVDGSHIRTLLLTFFFRHMQPIIEQGYLYIAQPPLYKAKIGKKEQYLKDEKAFRAFLLDWARDQTTLAIDEQSLSTQEWTQLLEKLERYDDRLTQACTRFHVSADRGHRLLLATQKSGFLSSGDIQALLHELREQFPDYAVNIEYTTPSVSDDIEQLEEEMPPSHERFVFKFLNREWHISRSFFESAEAKELLHLLEPLLHIEGPMWKLGVAEKDRFISGTGAIALMRAIGTLSKSYLNVQRYKGLGEMNPEQLWETSMDKTTRSLLKVTIEDAIEADRWFTVLMGDDVSGRKEYIELYGQFAKNLDV